MLWLICIIGAVIFCGVLSVMVDGYFDPCSILVGFVVGGFLALILYAGFVTALENEPTTVYKIETAELIALHDGLETNMHGVFYLGTGYISSEDDLEYRFIHRTDKGMTIGERDASRVYLEYIEDDGIPCLVRYAERYDNAFWNWLLGAVNSWETFYVPEGSITNSITIDLQ